MRHEMNQGMKDLSGVGFHGLVDQNTKVQFVVEDVFVQQTRTGVQRRRASNCREQRQAVPKVLFVQRQIKGMIVSITRRSEGLAEGGRYQMVYKDTTEQVLIHT